MRESDGGGAEKMNSRPGPIQFEDLHPHPSEIAFQANEDARVDC
jgi:hypothetical protein